MCFFRKKKKKVEVKKVEVKEVKSQKVEVKPDVVDPKVEDKEVERKVVNVYHVSQNKDSKSEHHKKWRVRKEGSNKTIKFFDTQLEAIGYAEELSKNNDGSVVIHKVDGKIRKQDYSK